MALAYPAEARGREKTVAEARRYPSEPQENLLYFMEKNAPLLESWQREILRIVRKVSQYFLSAKNRLR
ncbi:SpoVR family protein [Escherichia coli]|uniref:SpoVR family protein n=1 Tax=Escherichia coli TaxID=562 RepID=A0A376L607_ECOLX|nr:SpoVR family protein [Escherichia coli]